LRCKEQKMKLYLATTICLWLLLGASAPAQTPNREPRSLDSILAIEEPNVRVNALQQFLRTNSAGEKAQAAREALAASYAQLGEAQLGDNNIEKALDLFQRAIRALPKQVSDRFFEEVVSKIPLAVSTRGYRAEAVSLGKMLETRFANEAERLAALGEYYLTIEAAGEAVTPLENALRLSPEDARLHRALGFAYRMCLRISDAVAAYQLAVRYDSKDRRAFYDLADLYRSQGAYDDALKLYQKQLEIEPKHTASYKGLALAYTALGKDTEAAAALNQVRDLRGSSDEIKQDNLLQTQLAFYYLAQNKLKAARQAADAALAVEPRFSWARIVAAEVELADGKYFEAERHLLAAQQFANFPTLAFTLGKLYLIVEDFDGASEQFAKAFIYTAKDKFTTRLGGVRDVQADELKDLLAPEHQAAIFLAEPPTSEELFKIAESLTRVNAKLQEKESEKAPDTKAAPAGKESGNNDKLEQAARTFVEAEGSRRSFRALYMARRLSQAGRVLPLAIKLTNQALELAEVATEAEGSVRDYPNYDRDGRLRIFRGRAHDARGWALFKLGRNREALLALSEAVKAYGPLPEGKRALWHLATAKEAAGELPVALEMYLAAYEAPANKNSVDVNRTVIELLYRKVHGSLNGLNERLGQPLSPQTLAVIVESARVGSVARTAAPETAASANTEVSANEPAKAATTATPSNNQFSVNQLLVNRQQQDRPAASKSDPSPAPPLNQPRGAADPAASGNTGNKAAGEPLRVGLYGIPVNSGKPRITAPPTTTAQTKPSATSETTSVNPAPNQPATHSPAPVVAKEETTKELVAEVSKEASKPSTEEPKQTVAAPPETAPANLPATTANVEVPAAKPPEVEPFVPPPTPLVVPAIKLGTAREAKAVQLPELDQASLAAISLVVTYVPELAAPTWSLPIEVPEPPATRAVTAAPASEPTITIRFEDAPVKATTTEKTPTAPVPTSTRPRRVSESAPVNDPAPRTRKRRVTPAPNKP
jgi:tetratricopeptide (TPR) repeat protein